MTHVMVPCPEEHVAELAAGLMRLTLGMGGWNDDSIQAFVADLDGQERALVDMVAAASADHDRLPYRRVAAALGTDVERVLDLVTEVNDRCRRASFPLPLITDTMAEEAPDGTRTATPVLVIVRPVAQKILAQPRPASAPITSP